MKQFMTHFDPFIGDIELEKIGEISFHGMGVYSGQTIYKPVDDDIFKKLDHYFLHTWKEDGMGGIETIEMRSLSKKVIERIKAFEEKFKSKKGR